MFCKKVFQNHDWGNWEVTEKGKVGRSDFYGKDVIVGSFIKQKRKCTRCGLTKIKKQVDEFD